MPVYVNEMLRSTSETRFRNQNQVWRGDVGGEAVGDDYKRQEAHRWQENPRGREGVSRAVTGGEEASYSG